MAKDLSRLLVVDLEATCWDKNDTATPKEQQVHEIIETGHAFLELAPQIRIGLCGSLKVRPEKSRISEYCTNLTGWTQESIDSGMMLRDACKNLADMGSKNMTWASWGDYDRRQLMTECQDKHLDYPMSWTHINLKNLFAIMYGLNKEVGVGKALNILGWEFEGRQHNGGDDARNIARIAAKMFEKIKV